MSSQFLLVSRPVLAKSNDDTVVLVMPPSNEDTWKRITAHGGVRSRHGPTKAHGDSHRLFGRGVELQPVEAEDERGTPPTGAGGAGQLD